MASVRLSAAGSTRRRCSAAPSPSPSALTSPPPSSRPTPTTAAGQTSPTLRWRAIIAGTTSGAIALAGIAVLRADAPVLYDGLTGRAAPLIALSAAGGLGSLALTSVRRYRAARVAAVTAVGSVIWGWAVGQYPYLLVDSLTIGEGAGARATLVAMAASLAVGAVLFGPALVALLVMSQRGRLSEAPHATEPHEDRPHASGG